MKRRSKVKGIIITLVVLVLVAGAGLGTWYFLQNRDAEPVKVFSFQYIGMTEYWGDNRESYGSVSTDRIQTVFLTDTQKITEILVQPGDTVQKGDLLMTYDTTLSDLALERERLEVEKIKLQLETAQDELQDIKKLKPMVTPKPQPVPEVKPQTGVALKGDYQISTNTDYDGSSADKSLILWLRDGIELNDSIFEAVRIKAQEYQQMNAPAPTDPPVVPPVEEEITDPTGETEDPTEESTDPTEESTDPTEESTDPTEESTDPTQESTDPTEESTDPTEESTDPSEETTEPTTVPTVPPTMPSAPERCFVVLKVTEGDMSLTYTKVWQGMELIWEGDNFSFRLFDASIIQDHTVVRQEIVIPTLPQVDMGSGFTSKEIAQMRAEKEKQIQDLKFQVKMAEAAFAIKEAEAENGEVLAEIDGTVVSLLSEDEAKTSMQPILKISGGGGFYVKATVGELEKEELQIGQSVTVNDWNTGMTYTGSVQSIGDFPDPNGYWNGMGNPNVSYYPFTVFIGEEADLQEGSYVNIVYSTGSAQQGIYLENPFLRTEQGRSYVYVRGADGKLEQRFVTTGKALWGSYTQILSGLTPEDFLAFPYGRDLVQGADTVESDLSELYG